MTTNISNRVIILVDPASHDGINWEEVGTVVTELPELYQSVKESDFDLLLADEDRVDLTPGIAMKLHRYNGLMDIWSLVDKEYPEETPSKVFDGQMSTAIGQKGIEKKVSQIIAVKDLLRRYGIVGRAPKIKAIATTIERIAPTDVSVLIVGPSGSGKELVANALHNDSPRHDKPFVAINCGALAEGVLESELFGHEKGAFTGSVSRREGLFHKAEGGTVFLDEIGETRADMQVKLLRVLEDGTYYPVGSSTALRADVRIVAATNRDLADAIADRSFREDLYFRISVVKIVVPPLYERKRDIQPLLQYFWRDNKELSYSDAALELLMRYDWPGNVRQLRNFASHTAALKQTGLVDEADVQRFLSEQHVSARHLPVSTGRTVEEAGHELIYHAILQLGNEIRMLRDLITSHLPSEPSSADFEHQEAAAGEAGTMDDMEKLLIEQTLKATGGNRKEAARRLGIGERTLYRKINKYGLS